MPANTLHFWFEFASNYSYLSVERIEDMAAAKGVTVEWHPFLLGPIFRAQGWDSSPFNIYPAKGKYVWRDMERLTRARGLPLRVPDPFPQNSILAARIALAALEHPQGKAFCTAVYRAEFAQGKTISDPQVLRDALSGSGLNPNLIERADNPAIKARLKDNTERAVELGIFGAPSFVVGDELFWGDDRLADAIDMAAE
ncbi:DsbA family protein [Arenibacterium sp. CAU 1754]